MEDDEFVNDYGMFSGSGYSTSSKKEPDSLTYEDLERMIEMVSRKAPPMKILVSGRLSEGNIYKVDYKDTIYFLMNRTDLDREIDKIPMVPANDYQVPSGALGTFSGVPIYEDDLLIIEILVYLLRKQVILQQLRGIHDKQGPIWHTGMI